MSRRTMAQLRAWDACTFLAILNDEPEAEAALQVLERAEQGHIHIVASTLAVVEVLKMKGRTPVGPEAEEMIESFFDRSSMTLRNLDPRTSKLARQLVWRHGIDARDAVHVATALLAKVERLDTKDDRLLKKSPLKIEGFEPLKLLKPGDDDMSDGLFAVVDGDDEA